MLTENDLSPKQQAAINHLYGYDHTLLIAPTGGGKTVICLTAIKELIDAGELKRVIVACPAKVVDHWPKEVGKWSHLTGLVVNPLVGDKAFREAFMGQLAGTDALVVSLNNLDHLLTLDHGADGIIIDELSKASGKQASGLRSKKKAGMFKWRVGMTATPVSQDFQKLYGMARIIDGGKALGTNKQKYLENYFYSDYMGYNWTLRDGADEAIMAKVRNLIHAVEDTKEAELPRLHDGAIIRFQMPEQTRALYEEMKRDMVAGDVEAANEAVKSGKLRQLASGFLYGEDGVYVHTKDVVRFLMCNNWVEKLTQLGCKGVIFYEYKAQLALMSLSFDRDMVTDNIDVFKDGDAQILLAQVDSLSHGVDGLQHVCSDALFYHPMWSRDATEQAIGRLWRTGQKNEVRVTTLVCDDTLDDLVMARVSDRSEWMKLFLKHLKG